MTIDALEYAKRLEKADFTREQAEAIAAGLRDAVVPQLASKPNLDAAVALLKRDIDLLKAEFTGKFTLLYWMIGFNIAATMAVLWRLLR